MLKPFIGLALVLLSVRGLVNSAPTRIDLPAQEARPHLTVQDVSQRQGAASGDSASELELAEAYWRGSGVPENRAKAVEWYEKAAEHGSAEAQDFLGEIYMTGDIMPKNEKAAVSWYKKAARSGNVNAMFNLGVYYYNGDGVGVNDGLSYAWFTLAKEGGAKEAAAAVQRAESELKDWQITDSLKQIAQMYEKNGDMPENQAEAARWWLKAAARGDQDAQLQIANKLPNGQGVTQDFTQARHWCEEAAKVTVRGEYCIGFIYQRGLGVTADAKEARKRYEFAGKRGDGPSAKALAQMELAGEGGKVDRIDACVQYARLAWMGDNDAIQTLRHLKKQMSTRDWKKVQEQLRTFRIDPKKLDAMLMNVAGQ